MSGKSETGQGDLTENQLLATFVLIAIGCFLGGCILLYSIFWLMS
jgi:hypothetical protein